MNKSYLLFPALLISYCFAQQIPNANFDSVYIGGIDRVYQWITADGFAMYAGEYQDTVGSLYPDSSYEASGFYFSEMWNATNLEYIQPYHGASMKITQILGRKTKNGRPFPSFITSGEHLRTDSLGYPDFSRSAYPFSDRPDSIRGYYRFSDSLSAVDNWGRILLFLKKYNFQTGQSDTIAYLNSTLDLNPTQVWKPFSIAIPYLSSDIPDSLSLSFFASALEEQFGVLWLDELEFVYKSTSVSSSTSQASVVIYPNPGLDRLSLKGDLTSFAKMEIWSLNGKLVWRGEFSSEVFISSLENGFYFLRMIKKNGEVAVLRFEKG